MNVWIEKYKTIGIAAIVTILAVILFFFQSKDSSNQEFQASVTTEMPVPDEQVEIEEDTRVFVDVKGAVNRPGIYEAGAEDRVFAMIELAGGFLADADENQVNLAQKVYDEMVLYIPKIGESLEELEIIEEGSVEESGKININKADAAELETLPGIGPAKAAAIIQYREEHGPFQGIEEMQNISGIGAKTFEKFKDLIKVK
ncbi:helix-hairpin-helix domain-containing protein [Bacillus sp. FJAT-50079]|nr:helix-hairpin-helix domain-containing protein [Bacillus sp. FJAT-50079]MBS4209046.1 helix-hairpin-helix domain-containing protein [Bacillus sp. FJAT-50079]